MEKHELLETITANIAQSLESTLQAADDAHATATHKDNVAENKYDTLGLEAAYLAHGQSERVLQLQSALQAFKELAQRVTKHDQVSVGSLIRISSAEGEERYLFIGPASGGLVVEHQGTQVTVITPDSPLGAAMMGGEAGDDIVLASDQSEYVIEIVS